MAKIEKLTDEQIAKFPEYVEKWLAIGLSCDPCNVEESKRFIRDAYAAANETCPERFFLFDSPMAASIAAGLLKAIGTITEGNGERPAFTPHGAVTEDMINRVWDSLIEQIGHNIKAPSQKALKKELSGESLRARLSEQVYGCHDAYWLAFYDYFQRECQIDCSQLNPLMSLSEHCGWWAPYDTVVIMQHRPLEVHFDERKLLHNETGPAILYRDGYAVHAWHGLRVPREWFVKKPTAAEALTWPNVELRRAACEMLGWVNVLEELEAKTIDKHPNPMVGELVSVELPDVGRERFLRVKCGTNRLFALPVPPDTKTAEQAQRWLGFIPDDVPFIPSLRT